MHAKDICWSLETKSKFESNLVLHEFPFSGPLEYIQKGFIPLNHTDFKDMAYEHCLRYKSKSVPFFAIIDSDRSARFTANDLVAQKLKHPFVFS